MGIKKLKMLSLWAILFVSAVNCSQKEMDPKELCEEFYQLNKDRSFDGLFDVSIGSGRVLSVYDKSANQYDLAFKAISVFDTIQKNYVNLLVFKREASLSEKDSVFEKIEPGVRDFLARKFRVQSEDLFDSYVKYVDNLYMKYDVIKTPEWFNYKDVVVEGNPSLGKFITFTLNEKVKVYYLADQSSLSQYWSKHFKEISKINEEWYYEIMPDKISK